MNIGDRIRYTGKHDRPRKEYDGQVAEVKSTWTPVGANFTCARVKFTDGFETNIYADECEIVAAAETAVKQLNKEADQNEAETNADNEAG